MPANNGSACPNRGRNDRVIDTLELTTGDAGGLKEGNFPHVFLESTKFLIQVDGPWADASPNGGSNLQRALGEVTINKQYEGIDMIMTMET